MDGINGTQHTGGVATAPPPATTTPATLNEVADRTLGARVSASPASTTTPVPSFGNANAIVQYAQAHVGHRVGNGECTTLADAALRAAGAKTTEQVDPPRAGETQAEYGNQDYRWGTQVPPDQAQPGDIMQFRNYEMDTHSVAHTDNADGSWREQTRDQRETAGHHTAIVLSNDGNGRYTVLEQNAPHGGPVRRHQITLQDQHSQSTAPGRNGASTTTTTDVHASGQVTFYRPIPR